MVNFTCRRFKPLENENRMVFKLDTRLVPGFISLNIPEIYVYRQNKVTRRLCNNYYI